MQRSTPLSKAVLALLVGCELTWVGLANPTEPSNALRAMDPDAEKDRPDCRGGPLDKGKSTGC